MSNEQQPPVKANEIPLFIGAGVTFEGTVRHAGPQNEKAVILGTFEGNVEWNGIMQVPRGGKLVVQKSLRCRELVVAGEIAGASEDVVIETGLLRLADTAAVEVATVSVPPGGLEQVRGSVINAKLRMTKENPYAGEQPVAPQPRLILAASATSAPADPGSSLEGAGGRHVTTEARVAGA